VAEQVPGQLQEVVGGAGLATAAVRFRLRPRLVGQRAGDVVARLEELGRGWTARLDNALTTAAAGRTGTVPVYVLRDAEAARTTTVTLTAKSEAIPASAVRSPAPSTPATRCRDETPAAPGG
jgi:hypothetical protein